VSPLEQARRVQAALPAGGLFHEKEWRISPRPFLISTALHSELQKLGYRLVLFLRAADLLYRQSAKGKQPAWIADLLDRGKPPELIAFQRNHGIAGEIPRVIRPDLVLTEGGFTIAEIDSVPGGIGLTAWLNATYESLGHTVLGGARGMIDGFASILRSGDIMVSDEAATYRPEMEWLAAQLQAHHGHGGTWRVVDGNVREDWQTNIYRFFELFDLANVPAAPRILASLAAGERSVTPPIKPALEEKLLFALFWLKPLETFWFQELGERAFLALRKVIPYTWLLDPEPLPRHAVLPHLDAQSWTDVANLSQKKRPYILKISGFSEEAWGSRGVVLASDLSQREWQEELEAGLAAFPHHPHILQQFHAGRLVEESYLSGDELLPLRGRVRLCPYYFIGEKTNTLAGALATICPDDKKLLHGMRDAILAPTALEM